MKTELVDPVGIRVGQRFRAADPAKIATLAESMRVHGLLQPITVRMIGDTEAELVAGLHRLEAARLLEWEWIDAVFVEVDDVERELIEIAENLHRCDLTKEERDRQIRRYAELLEAKSATEIQVPQDAAPEIGYKKPPPQTKGIASQIAEATGLSKDTVQRAINDTPERKAQRVQSQHARDVEKRDLQQEATEKVAELLAEHIPGEHWDALKANLHTAGCHKLAAEFARLVGVAVFDQTRAA